MIGLQTLETNIDRLLALQTWKSKIAPRDGARRETPHEVNPCVYVFQRVTLSVLGYL